LRAAAAQTPPCLLRQFADEISQVLVFFRSGGVSSGSEMPSARFPPSYSFRRQGPSPLFRVLFSRDRRTPPRELDPLSPCLFLSSLSPPPPPGRGPPSGADKPPSAFFFRPIFLNVLFHSSPSPFFHGRGRRLEYCALVPLFFFFIHEWSVFAKSPRPFDSNVLPLRGAGRPALFRRDFLCPKQVPWTLSFLFSLCPFMKENFLALANFFFFPPYHS